MIIYSKTQQGRDELLHPSNVLGAELLCLLALIDGKSSPSSLLAHLPALSQINQPFDTLLNLGLIEIESSTKSNAPSQSIIKHSPSTEGGSANMMKIDMEADGSSIQAEFNAKLSDLTSLFGALFIQARVDKLTGLLLRKAFEADYPACSNQVNTIMFIDVDHFKSVNDSLGHEAGDSVLQGIALTIKNTLRPQDVAARWGGDEFVVLSPKTTRDEAASIAERLRDAIEKEDLHGVTLSIGITLSSISEPLGECVKRADEAVYIVKKAGKNGVAFAEATNGESDSAYLISTGSSNSSSEKTITIKSTQETLASVSTSDKPAPSVVRRSDDRPAAKAEAKAVAKLSDPSPSPAVKTSTKRHATDSVRPKTSIATTSNKGLKSITIADSTRTSTSTQIKADVPGPSKAKTAEPEQDAAAFEIAKQFIVFNINTHLGWKGFLLKGKISKVDDFEELRALRDSVIAALAASKAGGLSRDKITRLDALLYPDAL